MAAVPLTVSIPLGMWNLIGQIQRTYIPLARSTSRSTRKPALGYSLAQSATSPHWQGADQLRGSSVVICQYSTTRLPHAQSGGKRITSGKLQSSDGVARTAYVTEFVMYLYIGRTSPTTVPVPEVRPLPDHVNSVSELVLGRVASNGGGSYDIRS